MADLLSFADRTLYCCHRSIPKVGCGGLYSSFRSFPSSSSVFFLRQFHGIELPSLRSSSILGGDRDRRRVFFEKFTKPFSSYSPPPCCDVAAAAPPLQTPWLMVPPGVVVVENKTTESNNNNNDDCYNFFSIHKQKEFRIKKPITKGWQRELLTPDDALCIGSSHGWLAFMNPQNCYTYLLNPFFNENENPTFYVPLPALETLPNIRGARVRKMDPRSPSPSLINEFILFERSDHIEFDLHSQEMCSDDYWPIRRLAMSSPPFSSSHQSNYNENCTVMVIEGIYDDVLAFCKPGDETWTGLVDASGTESLGTYVDLAYFSKDQRFYALDEHCCIESWDLSDPSSPKRTSLIEEPHSYPPNPNLPEQVRSMLKFNPNSFHFRRKNYLVESLGDLLLVIRFIAIDVSKNGANDDEITYSTLAKEIYYGECRTLRFDVYRLDFVQKRWEFVECLGDRALFVGSNHSFSLSTTDCPGLRENSIYFTDDEGVRCSMAYRYHDNGVFNLEFDCVSPYYPNSYKRIEQPPIWVAPCANTS